MAIAPPQLLSYSPGLLPVKKIVSFSNFPYTPLLFGAALGLAVYQIILGSLSPDEIEGVHTAWKIFNGERIYVDFFQHHHPLFYYLLVPAIALGGETLFALHLAEFLVVVIFAGIVVTTYRLCGEIYGDRTISRLSVLLLLVFPWFISHGTHIRPDPLQVLLGLLSFLYLVRWLEDGRARRHLALSALLLSLSFLVLQKAVFLIFVVGLILFARLLRSGSGGITMRDFLLYGAVFSLLPALWVLWLLMTGELRNYIDFNWLVNMKYMHSFSAFKRLSWSTSANLSMAGFALLFIAGCFVRSPGNGRAHRAALLAGACLVASIFLVRAPFPQYLLMAMPFVAIVAAASLRHFFSGAMTGLILTALLGLCSVHLIERTKDGGFKRGQISTMRHVLEISGPGDVYFGDTEWNLFRRNTDFFWFCFPPKRCLETLRSFREYDWDPVRLIVENRPKVIGLSFGSTREWYASLMEDPRVAPWYERSPEHREIYTRKEAPSR